jgi:hypothetical protein
VTQLLDGDLTAPPLDARLGQAAKFSWAEHARVVATAYGDLVARPAGVA